MRYGGSTYHNILRVGQTVYDPPVQACSDGKVLAIETQLQESKLFGVIGGIRWIGMPAWLTGYFLVSVPAMMLIKRGLRVR
jgi:hypothetical protein